MKVNAPEKIYIQPRTIEQLPHQSIVYTKPLADNSIEYVRTDAFIEKAVQFLKDKGSAYITIIDGQLILRKGVVKDFRKYMEG